MSTFALDLMPTFVERVIGPEDFKKFKVKATKYGLPMVLFFSEDRRIMNEMKFLSTEFRRRVLIAHISLAKKENKNIFFEYGVRGQALLVVPPTHPNDEDELGETNKQPDVVAFDGKWNLHRLSSFFSEHALKSEVTPKSTPDEKANTDTKERDAPERTEKVKTEL